MPTHTHTYDQAPCLVIAFLYHCIFVSSYLCIIVSLCHHYKSYTHNTLLFRNIYDLLLHMVHKQPMYYQSIYDVLLQTMHKQTQTISAEAGSPDAECTPL